jgi:molybdopterin-guanine dinucleotide biosynthesis protein A
MAPTAGLLLTGGASTRLGVSKAELRRGGERLADRAARLLREVSDPVLEVGPGVTSLPAVREDPPGAGPLAAVVAGADALTARGHSGPVLVLAVDLPFVDAAALRWLADHPARGTVVPTVGGAPQTLCGRYDPAALVVAATLRAEGAAAMRALLERIDVTYADEGDWGRVVDALVFSDVDTPDAVARAGLEWPARDGG